MRQVVREAVRDGVREAVRDGVRQVARDGARQVVRTERVTVAAAAAAADLICVGHFKSNLETYIYQ